MRNRLLDDLRGSAVRRWASACRPVARRIVISLVLTASGSAGWAAEPRARNQASAADTIILPAATGDGAHDATSRASLLQAVKGVGLQRLDHVAIIDASVDPDGCMAAPLSPNRSGGHSEGLDVVAEALRHRGITVTIISSRDVQAVDLADQNRIQAIKGSFQLSFGEATGRWLATKAEMTTCMRSGGDRQEQAAHPPLAAMLAALHQDVVLAINDSEAMSKGTRWNIIEGALSSNGNSLDAGTSQASVSATLVLKNGATPWTGEAHARGALRPPLDRRSVGKLDAYMEGELRKMDAYRAAHPGAKEPPDQPVAKTFDAITSGDLDQAPEGTTLGPSARATLQAAADRLIDQMRPILPAR